MSVHSHHDPVTAEGAKAERAYAKDPTDLPDPTSPDNPEFQIVLAMIRDGLKKNPTRWTKQAEALQGRSLGPKHPVTMDHTTPCVGQQLYRRACT